MKYNYLIRKSLCGVILLGMALAPVGMIRAQAAETGNCPTKMVSITLASQQVSFCSPTSRPYQVVEDNIAVPEVPYAQLNQVSGYGIVNIKAATPGYAPGLNRPVYTGDRDAYHQAVRKMESANTDRVVSEGPSAIFWGESVPSFQMDISMPASSGNDIVRTIEWDVDHAGRLWSIIIGWDTGMQNANEWQAASDAFSIQQTDSANGTDTTIDLGSAFQYLKTRIAASASSSIVDVGMPAWWGGYLCDMNNFYKANNDDSYALGTPWHGVVACGPFTFVSPYLSRNVQFYPGAWGEIEFECVELVMRFLYLEWGIAPWEGNANTIKDYYPTGSMVFYANDGTHAIVPGDIITENATSGLYGHSVIVTSVNVDGTGTGTISLLEQNSSPSGSRSLSINKWSFSPDAWTGNSIQGWLHVKANSAVPTPTTTLTPSVTSTPTITRTPSVTPAPSKTPTPTWTGTVTSTPTITLSPTVTPTPTITLTPTTTLTRTNTPTNSPTPSVTFTPTITLTPSVTPTRTNTHTRTPTPTRTLTPTITLTPTPHVPGVPAMESPVNNALITNYSPSPPVLDWWDTVWADHYRVQMATNNTFSTLLVDQNNLSVSSYHLVSPLTPNTTYYWRVRAINSIGQSGAWSSIWSFRTAILAPTLQAPGNAVLLNNKRPTFTWNSVAGGTSYTLEVSSLSDFASDVINTSQTQTNYTPTSDLTENAKYYWRVKANGPNGPSLHSQVWTFTTGNPPSVPSLVTPIANVLVLTTTPLLDWSTSSLPSGTTFAYYQVELATNSAFSSPIVNSSSQTSRTTSQLTSPGLAANTQFYWRVRAANTFSGMTNFSAWSPAGTFRTALSPPVLTAPVNGGSVTSPRPTLDWTDVSGVTGYTIQVSKNNIFSSLVVNVSPTGTVSAYTPAANLPNGILLYWRVQSRGTNGPSAWSVVSTFIVNP